MKLLAASAAVLWMLAALPVALAAQRTEIGAPPVDPAKAKANAVERARKALGEKLKVPPASLVLESAKEATWGDASLGCPEPDRMYAQVVTSGYAVVLKADEKRYEVHVGGTRAVVCPAVTDACPKPVDR